MLAAAVARRCCFTDKHPLIDGLGCTSRVLRSAFNHDGYAVSYSGAGCCDLAVPALAVLLPAGSRAL